jgi:hypothetical protein
MRPILVVALATLAFATVASRAEANPRPLPFTYTSETLPAGSVELEQFGDLIPVKVYAANGNKVDYLSLELQTELEIGITDRLELGLYFTAVPRVGDQYIQYPAPVSGNGLRQRIRYQFADPGEMPVDVGVYGEVSENERLIELEAKVLLARRFGAVRVAANAVFEYELYFAGNKDVEVEPTLGATVEITPKIHLGLESWMHVELPDPAPATRGFNLGALVYAGPVAMFNFGKIWWATGIYARVNELDHTAAPGDSYGPIWIRTIVGFGL